MLYGFVTPSSLQPAVLSGSADVARRRAACYERAAYCPADSAIRPTSASQFSQLPQDADAQRSSLRAASRLVHQRKRKFSDSSVCAFWLIRHEVLGSPIAMLALHLARGHVGAARVFVVAAGAASLATLEAVRLRALDIVVVIAGASALVRLSSPPDTASELEQGVVGAVRNAALSPVYARAPAVRTTTLGASCDMLLVCRAVSLTPRLVDADELQAQYPREQDITECGREAQDVE